MQTKRLQILEASLIKKETAFSNKIAEHFGDVKRANGQPLNDKRNGQATYNRWDKQNEAIRNIKEGIEKTKNAIEREQHKIKNVQNAKETLPKCILEMLDTGELIQWRKYPNTFFVKDVKKARIVWDEKRKLIFTRYKNSITDQETWLIFAITFNFLLNSLQNNLKEETK